MGEKLWTPEQAAAAAAAVPIQQMHISPQYSDGQVLAMVACDAPSSDPQEAVEWGLEILSRAVAAANAGRIVSRVRALSQANGES